MAAVKAKAAQNGAGKKPKSAAPSTGTSTPVTTVADSPTEAHVSYGAGKPDKALYDAEQAKIKAEIDALQLKLNAVKDKINVTAKGSPNQERRNELLTELKEIRSDQGNIKQSRNRIFEQLKTINEGIKKKTSDLNAAKGKLHFKSVEDVDEAIRQREKQVESGTMKVADEKRALAEISQFKRSRRLVENFAGEQAAIDADRAQADALRKQLDDPEMKAKSDRYDAIQTELDALKAEADKAHEARGTLYDERTALQAALDALYNQKRDSQQRFRDANDRHWAKVTEERARRAERLRQQRAEEEERKKKELADRLREEADVPAFQAQIEDCQTLIDYFSGGAAPTRLSTDKAADAARHVAGVPDLDIRKVDAAPAEGMVVRKKKGEDDEAYFVGGGKKKGGKKHHGGKGAHAHAPAPADASANGGEGAAAAAASGDRLHVPLPTLSALLSLSIPPPASTADLPRVVADLQTKKAWFEANQARATAEAKAKAEKEIHRLIGKYEHADATPSPAEPNGEGAELAEATPEAAKEAEEKPEAEAVAGEQ
ncbi:hypothetical protein EIP86_001773 [Pleurotus ostreatoroseus]|nr:hypothetical protein EIP86_001773 [Pleurotus ostreatoroseus]